MGRASSFLFFRLDANAVNVLFRSPNDRLNFMRVMELKAYSSAFENHWSCMALRLALVSLIIAMLYPLKVFSIASRTGPVLDIYTQLHSQFRSGVRKGFSFYPRPSRVPCRATGHRQQFSNRIDLRPGRLDSFRSPARLRLDETFISPPQVIRVYSSCHGLRPFRATF